MIRRRYISTRLLKDGMIIDQSIIDRAGRILIARKTALDPFLIEALQRLSVSGVYIREGEEDPEEESILIPPKVIEAIEKQTVPDRPRLQLSESGKKHVCQGIQFLYANTSSQHFAEAANDISDSLLKAIEENDAIAMDISILKVSDEYTFRHSVDVAAMGMIVARKAGMSSREIRELGLAGLLHDIGKSKIPPELLNKTGRLSDEEFSIMKKHPFLGYQLLKEKKDIPRSVKLAVLQHHEKISGKGYPFGIKGDQINSYSKIISITDIYDALVTERPYKKAFSQRDAVEMIMAMTDDLDVSAMRSFLGSVILYPVGSTVSLNNGERARVVKNTPGYPLRPKVIGLKTGRVYDLSEDIRCASVIIE